MVLDAVPEFPLRAALSTVVEQAIRRDEPCGPPGGSGRPPELAIWTHRWATELDASVFSPTAGGRPGRAMVRRTPTLLVEEIMQSNPLVPAVFRGLWARAVLAAERAATSRRRRPPASGAGLAMAARVARAVAAH